MLQNYLLGFLEALHNYYTTYVIDHPTTTDAEWPQFLLTNIEHVARVDVTTGDIEGEESVDNNPFVQ